MDKIKRLELEREREMNKWTDLYCGALALALKRFWGYGTKRIQDVINRAYDVSEECANYGKEKSMIQMLDEETGIELRSYTDNRSYRETAFLSTNIKYKKLNDAQYMCMIISQIKWMRPVVLSILCLAMYRQQGFGYERLVRLISQMDEIINDHNQDKVALLRTARDEAKFVMQERVN